MMYIDPVTGKEEEEISWGDEPSSDDDLNELLGFDLDGMESQDRSGLRALIGSALVYHRRLPALEMIFERSSRLMTTTLRHLAGDALDVSLDGVSSARFSDVQDGDEGQFIFAPIQSAGLDNFSLLMADKHFIFAIVDFLLGGRRTVSTPQDGQRSFTPIELALARRVLKNLCADISSAFSSIIQEPFELKKIETCARYAAITRENSVCFVAKFRVNMGEVSGNVRIVMPYAALEPIEPQLKHEYIQENGENRSRWHNILLNELSTTDFEVSVILAECALKLREISSLSVGDVLTFDSRLDDPVFIQVGQARLATARLGRSGEHYAAMLENDINPNTAHTGDIS